MSNEKGRSSRSVHKQEINAEELKPILSESFRSGNRNATDNFSPIYEVPSRLRKVNPSAFTPQVVSIGPLHKNLANVKLMEDQKETYMDELLREVGSHDEVFKACMEKVSGSIQDIKGYYFGHKFNPKKYPDEKFARMMVMDACFILQFINKLFTPDNNIYSKNRLRSRYIAVDLVLLENQIPFFVLQDIYDLTLGTSPSKPRLTTMLQDLLQRVNPFDDEIGVSKVENLSGLKHILGHLHESYQPEYSEPPPIPQIPTAHRSAVELHTVGVRFAPNQKVNWIMAMQFEQSWHKPTLRVPKVLIDNLFEVVIRNLIAYEQYSTPVRNYVTSYAMAMNILASTPADIAKLGESDVIMNNLGSNEKASDMISSICKDVTFHDFDYIETWKDIEKHYDTWWSKNFGVFKRKYCSTLWKAIALVAAIIVFLVTVIQFSFRMKTYASTHRM